MTNLFEKADPDSHDIVIERIVFQNPENGWTVARIRLEGDDRPATAVGRLFGVSAGERLQVSADWIRDRKYGKQLRIHSFLPLDPASLRGLERFLGSGLLPGVGKVMARRIVDHFGESTLKILDESPERLLEVSGIGTAKARKITQAWAGQRQARQAMIFLQGHEISPRFAARIIKRFGSDAVSLVRQNPYRLAEEIAGIGFSAADRVARSLGWAPEAPERIGGGALYALKQGATNGHLFLLSTELTLQTSELLGVDQDRVTEVMPGLQKRRAIVVDVSPAGDQRVYLPEPFAAETGISSHLLRLLDRKIKGPAIAIDKALSWFEERNRLHFAPTQRQAVARALQEKLLILTGGPGTGKTTLMRAVVEILSRKNLKILLAAPTGRAANRLSDTTGRDVRTIHRLLEFDPHTLRFRRNGQRPLEADLVIVDETSMIDAPLALCLLEALATDTRLLLVGDADQLPSVGPGRVLSDLIESSRVPVVRLHEIYRQKEAGGIVVNAHRIHRGLKPQSDSAEDGDFFFIRRSQPEEILSLLLEVVAQRVPKSFGLDPRRDIQVLSPMRRGQLGTETLNEELRGLLNPGSRSVDLIGRWRPGDRVMQTRNNYDIDVFNGDIGFVTGSDSAKQRLVVDFDGREVVYQNADLEDLTLAYACTVHKSQGSEYPCVVLPMHTQHFIMLQRNLLYTAVTRAQRLMIIVGDPRALEIALGNQRQRDRNTGLAERIRTAGEI
jgi:exodeoxyribonuclease V alpha subunit